MRQDVIGIFHGITTRRPCVAVEIDNEGIALVTFNRPEKGNAMNPTLHYEMEEIMMHLETDAAAKVIALTGAEMRRARSWT